MKKLFPAAAAVLTLLTSHAFAAEKGTLCFVAEKQNPACSATDSDIVKVTPSDSDRSFVWSSADGKRLLFAILPAKGSSIAVVDPTLTDVTLSVRGDKAHGWPADLRLSVSNNESKKSWSWTVPAKSVATLTQLALPKARYGIKFSADHHLTEMRGLDVPRNRSLGEIVLRPMPVVTGRVLTAKDEAVANAQVVREDHKVIATSDEQGNFRGEALEPLPDTLLVEKSGFGSRMLSPRLATGDADLGIIRLGAATKLALRIVRPDGNNDALSVRIKRRGEKYDWVPVASKQLAAADDTIAFEDLEKGTYAVIIEGKNAFEKLFTTIDMGEADMQKEIKIQPYRVDGTAHLGDDPINGTLSWNMGGIDSKAESSLPIADGRFTATLWQPGVLHGWVKISAMESGEPVNSPELGADPSAWNIQLPKRLISGRVFDVDDGQAIKGSSIQLMRTSAGSRLYTSIKLDDSGAYTILATKAGTYELKTSAPDHVDMKQTIEIREDEASVQRDFAMSRGVPTTIEVTWPSGTPIANAEVLEGVASDGHNAERRYRLDPAGRLTLRLLRGEARTLFIVPAVGSFAIAHVEAQEGSDSAPLRVVVPDAAGALQMKITKSDGKPAVAEVGLRFNGELVPTPVLHQIGFRAHPQMLDSRTLLQLPAGAYEVWPVGVPAFRPIGPSKSATIVVGPTTVDLVVNP